MSDDASDQAFMALALEAARRGLGRTSPNPAVGAVIVRDGQVIATGHHRRAGTDHAEVAALRKVDFSAQGCTLYSSLEPCDHFGRTGPCTEAILSAGVTRVVVGASDPNPKVRGRGLRKLESRGIKVQRGVLEGPCTELNEAYNHAIVARRPWVVQKAAISLDGRIATRTGESQWITGTAARRQGHRLRDQLDAVMVGVGTVLADDPLLTCRIAGGRNPVRVVLDSRLRTPAKARIVTSAHRITTLIATTKDAPAARRRALERAKVEILTIKRTRQGRVDPGDLLDQLYARGLISVLVEGGAQVHGSFVDAKLVGRVVMFVSPLVIGGAGAPSAIGGKGVAALTDALRLDALAVERLGPDLMISGRARR